MLWYIFEIITSLWDTEKNTEDKIEPIDQGWIALLSDIERKISTEQYNGIKSDLNSIDQNLKVFPRIFETVHNILFKYDANTLTEISSFPLAPDIKYRIFKDVFIRLSPDWLEYIVKLAPEVSDSWYPEKYRHNILGEMISITSHTSPDQLTVFGLSQTIKAVHLSLVQSLNSYRLKPLSIEESSDLLDLMMSSVISEITDLWIETITKCKRGLSMAGKTVAKINEQEEGRLKELRQIKEEGRIDAKYSTGESDSIRQGYLEGNQQTLLDHESFDLLKRQLSNMLMV